MLRKNAAVSFLGLVSCAVLALSALTQAQAQEKKADPTGTWIWTMAGRQGGPDRTNTLTLKAEGGKLTGKLSSPGRGGQAMDSEISDGKLKGDEISFAIVREFGGNSFTNKYSGKIAGDTIKGKMESVNRNGEPQSRDWEAKRAAEPKK